jgi:hypothetical protein
MTAYTLHNGDDYGLSNESNTSGFTFSVQFTVSETIPLTGIIYNSLPPATSLPSACCLFDADTEEMISGTLNSSPSWSGAAGSGPVKCSYSGVTLSPDINYMAAVFDAGGDAWWSAIEGYWTTGDGADGITNGPLSAPNFSSAVNGQGAFVNDAEGITFPASFNAGFDWGVDVEVTSADNITASGGITLNPFRSVRPR